MPTATFSFLPPGATRKADGQPPVEGGKLTGTIGEPPIQVTGERPPTWAACDANATHAFGKPVVLFDGTSIAAWDVQDKNKPSGWSVEEGAMTNVPKANNLVSKEQFKDFRLDAEYKLSPKGNSGIYLRGRYEMQVLDDAGASPGDEVHGHMAIYARTAPTKNVEQAGRRVADRADHDCRQLRHRRAERADHPQQRQDHRHHGRSAGREGDRARARRDSGGPREGVVQEGDRHSDHEVTVLRTLEVFRESPGRRDLDR